jgi:glutamate synthase (NADPH/NADH) small chain
VIIAAGAGRPMRLNVPGADREEVWDATRFLTAAHAALCSDAAPPPVARGSRVLVLGAGNTAMDVARTVRRFGAQAVCIDWMDRRFAPVRPDELAEAEEEGVVIRFNTTVAAIDGDPGHARSVRLARTRQRHAGDRPKVVGHAEELEVGLVVMAMGYTLDPALQARTGNVPVARSVPKFVDRRWVASGLLANPAPAHARHQPVGELAIGRETARYAAAAPRTERVWVAGDALTGPATVVDAMAQGKQAALGVIATARVAR